jgi:fido (protein-threonine AMPylation protein)
MSRTPSGWTSFGACTPANSRPNRPLSRTYRSSSLTDSYDYPGSEVLRNIWGIQTEDALNRFESLNTALCINQFNTGEVTIEGNFDLAHLCVLHRHTFRDVYAWTGELGNGELPTMRWSRPEMENVLRGDRRDHDGRVHSYATWGLGAI